MFSYLHSPTPQGRGGAGRGGDRQAIAASVTTLQQCGLPGSSAQPGGIAAAHGTDGWRCLGGKVFTVPAWQGQGNAATASSIGRHCSSTSPLCVRCPAPVHGGCTACSLFLDVACGFPAIAPSQSLIPAYPPLTSFQDSAADTGDFRVVLFKREQRQGTRGSNTSGEKGLKDYKGGKIV